MRVLLINAVYKTGSTGRMLMEMKGYLEKQGIDVYIACAQGCDGKDEHLYRIGNIIDHKLHALKSRITGYQCAGSILSTYKLLAHIKKIKPDVVHLHNLHSSFVNLHLLLNYLAKEDIPTVQSLHDCWNFTGKCTHYIVRKCSNWQFGCGNCPNLMGNIPSWFFDHTHYMLDEKKEGYSRIKRLAVVGVSKWIQRESKKTFLRNAKMNTFIYNWIDLDVFKFTQNFEIRKKFSLENKFIILGVANGWYSSKGLDKFVMLADILDPDEKIVLVGNMGKQNLPPGIISIPPTTSQKELAQYYSMADVFMQLSLEESFGKVVAESMACGTPIITIDSTANPELINERCGIVVPKDDLTAIKSAYKIIKKMKKNYYSSDCRKYAEQHFNMRNQIGKYVKIYEEIIEK